ncbi:hypothetical protein [Actinoallomurus iriomotensis]|uniref:Uncharacterized protein n=1 Tax=Actinoallomurus iriomotensis TaxID=478107 RepID=A0A9W6RUI1_9ACTN|nr:hypothetical protein [Actinoallomurus iriomotensis]GLY82050.1 hypothetical protein Airi01_103170 [Actinoallomurus iriomotensis]
MQTPAPVDNAKVIDLYTHEYDRLKDEQRARISHRDNLLYVTLAVYGASMASALAGKAPALLAVPLAAIILGWNYLANDTKVSDIGRYIRTELGPSLTSLTGGSYPVFGWENWHQTNDPRRSTRKTLWLVIDSTAYAVIPLGALLAFWVIGSPNALLIPASIIEAIAVLIFAAQIFTSANLVQVIKRHTSR